MNASIGPNQSIKWITEQVPTFSSRAPLFTCVGKPYVSLSGHWWNGECDGTNEFEGGHEVGHIKSEGEL